VAKYAKPMKQWVIWGGELPGGGVCLLASDAIVDTCVAWNSHELDSLEVKMMTAIEVRGETFEACLAALFRQYKDQGDTWTPTEPTKLPEPPRELEE